MEFIASEAVRFFMEQIAVGGVQRLAGDAFANLLRKLKGLLDYKFAGRPELTQAHEQPEVLEAVIVEEVRKDPDFYNKLKEIVTQLRQAEENRLLVNTNQSTNLSGVTQNTNNSGHMGDVVAGDKVAGDKVAGDKFR